MAFPWRRSWPSSALTSPAAVSRAFAACFRPGRERARFLTGAGSTGSELAEVVVVAEEAACGREHLLFRRAGTAPGERGGLLKTKADIPGTF